jgi:hypothetical protein
MIRLSAANRQGLAQRWESTDLWGWPLHAIRQELDSIETRT